MTSASHKLVETPSQCEETETAKYAQRWCGLNKPEADIIFSQAQAELANGDMKASQQTLLGALKLHPGLEYLYRHLGVLMDRQGNSEAAELCYRGVIPDVVNEQWFTESYTVVEPRICDLSDAGQLQEADTAQVSRHVCHEPITCEIPAPQGIKPPKDRRFNRRSLTSSVALVDHLRDGRLWFDGFNRAVTTADGGIVEQHTRGNPELIKAATTDFAPRHIKGRAFFVGNRGFNNYYHWMLDILPALSLFKQAGMEFNDDDHVVVFNGSSSFQKMTLEHLGFKPHQIVQINQFSPYISADELVVSFFSNGMATTMGEWVPQFLQENFLDADCISPSSSKRLYLARAKNARNGREIGNEEELIKFLESRGYEAVYPENHSIVEQASLFAHAESIVAAHGAGLTNIAFCKPGTTIIELFGDYMETCYWAMSAVCDLRYVNHFCSEEDASEDHHARSHKNIDQLRRQGFSVDTQELSALLDSI